DAEGFYQAISGNFVLKYKILNANSLHCKLSGNTNGWIAVGFDPTDRMKDANFIIGYVSQGLGYIRDDYGISTTAHASDTSIGGTSDVSLISAFEIDAKTHLEFVIPLNSGDSKDRVLLPGNSYQVIFASAAEDDFEGYHSTTGVATIILR
ncbi:MAG: DOMON domain-containing protein, partial [Candidatus Cloacimonadaceae bacterium]|nr:DOMON domain-containing protein [Candidatus Cloacimonadaceae bacterium]